MNKLFAQVFKSIRRIVIGIFQELIKALKGLK